MERHFFTAVYCGPCYVPAHGRKLYKHAVKLRDIRNGAGATVLGETVVSNSKTLSAFITGAGIVYGDNIGFSAVLEGQKLLYISDLGGINYV